MIVFDDEFKKYNKLMYEHFGTRIPTMQIDLTIDNEELFAVIDRSIKEGKDLLPEYFGYAGDFSDIDY